MTNDQQPGVPQQPENNGWQQPGQPGQSGQGQPGQSQPAPGQPPYPPRADQYNFAQPPYGGPAQPPYGDPAQPPYGDSNQGPYGQPGPGQFGQAPPKGGIPVWGWVAGGVGVAAVLAVTGVMVLGSLGSSKGGAAAPAPTASTRSSESAESSASAEVTDGATPDASAAPASGAESVYLFQDADFTSPPVWSTKIPDGWTMSDIKLGTATYRSSDNPCIFTTHQAILPPREATVDEEATAATMQAEIEGVRNLAGSPVTVVSDTGSTYTKLRNSDGNVIELQEAELRFKNKSNTDLVYRIAVRSMPAGNGLMELNLACPANLPTESDPWAALRDSVIMVDDPAA